jgi:hypothetical protein
VCYNPGLGNAVELYTEEASTTVLALGSFMHDMYGWATHAVASTARRKLDHYKTNPQKTNMFVFTRVMALAM